MPDDHILCLGFDVGSVALKVVLTDRSGNLLEPCYRRTHGRPVEATLEVLGELFQRHPDTTFDLIAATGSGSRLICELLHITCVNEVISQAVAIRTLCPGVRTLIEMGGQDSKIVFLPEADDPRPMLDFAMNTNCAAGTGSFLDQQASRLGIGIEEEFAALALKSVNPPRVAGRCSVFAKSDMIHLQQRAAPLHDIVAGLCLGLARNLKSNLAGGRTLPRPIAFCGGVAANRGVVRALEEVFDLDPGGLIVPEAHAVTGALGAVHVALKERARLGPDHARPAGGRLDLTALRHCLARPNNPGNSLAPLVRKLNGNGHPINGHAKFNVMPRTAAETPVEVWLGLDVGSISTKIAIIDADNHVLAKIYLMTAGRPLEAVRKVLQEIGRQVAALACPVVIRGAATTGSGRYLTGDIIGADLVINEITAQATAAAALDPQVESIFEIGGQDSKYIALDRGVVVDFEMNHACAAGTGSFLEEQAERLGVSIRRQFADLAFSSRTPTRLGERCTVFMESDLLSHQQKGAATPDLAAGLCYSIVSNYLNRVVGQRHIGQRIFFQGGTAFNEGVVAAFRQITGRPVIVPPHHEITGAIGAAILARRHMQNMPRRETRFAGFGAADLAYELRTFECTHCSNTCEINEVTVAGRDPLCYGSRCDRFNTRKEAHHTSGIPDLFNERHRLLLQHSVIPPAPQKGAHNQTRRPPVRPTVGIPLALLNYQLLPFWSTFLSELGFHPVLSPPSNGSIIQAGIEATLSTPCFPIKVAHGHVLDLVKRGVDFVFLPCVVTLEKEFAENRFNEACPYITFFPYTIAAALQARHAETDSPSPRLLMPSVRFDGGPRGVVQSLKSLRHDLHVSTRQLTRTAAQAWAAQKAFEDACKARGREILAALPADIRPVVIISRPYNGCDKQVSLDLAAKLRRLKVLAIPMDFLELSPAPTGDRIFEYMFWKYGQRILHAAKFIRNHPRLHAIYLSNFSCGPDSFLLSFFKRLMAPKPSLVLEIDEHSADAGVVTRLEAFLESLHHAGSARNLPAPLPLYPAPASDNRKRTLWIPWMSDHSHALAAGIRAQGRDARVLPLADEHTLALGRRHCTGKECLPCLITTGDMLHATRQPGFQPEAAAFFMPRCCGPCREGQYVSLHKLLLQESGHPDIPIIDPGEDSTFYDSWGRTMGDSSRLIWNAMCVVNALERCQLALRPYETDGGSTDALYQRLLKELLGFIETKPAESAIAAFATRAAADFAALRVDRRASKPRIGLVGEIYVRTHHLANNHLVHQLEGLGAEVCVASVLEYLLYCNWTRKTMALRERTPRHWITNFVQDEVERRIARRINRPFRPLVGDINETRTGRFVAAASFCVDPQFEGGETVLSIAKVLEFQRQGAHGVICVMPFGCMPTTIFAGLGKQIARHTGDMPLLTIAFDGQQDPALHTRLEAFLHQARIYQQTHARTPRERIDQPAWTA